MSVLRLGAVGYLNARPLVHELNREPSRIALRFDVPSACARLLAEGQIDLGLIPTIAHLDRPGDRVVPGVAIASEGDVASVALFTRTPLREIRSVALDTSSRTSVVLTRVLCARAFDIAPAFVSHGPDLAAMLAVCDAALLIGDPALFVDYRAHGAEKIDLGAAWTSLTDLPFVWAFWSGRPGAADATVVTRLQDARDRGVAESDAVADAYYAAEPARQPVARRYLRENIRSGLGPRALEGLRTYYREAASLGLAPAAPALEFFR